MQAAPSGFYFSKVDERNYRTQNDFRFAIVSVDDLDLDENSKKCPSVVEFLYRVWSLTRGLLCVMQAAPSEFYFSKVDERNYRTQNDFGFAIVSVDDLDLDEKQKMPFGR